MRKNIFTVTICLGLVFGMTSICRADDATKKESTKKLLTLLKIDTQMDSMNQKMKESAQMQLKAQNLPEPLYWKIEKVINKNFELVQKELNWQNISDDFIQVYMDVFEEKEIEQLNQFYSTELGQKLVDKLPELFARGMRISQSKLQAKHAEIQQIMLEEWKKFEESLTEEERALLQQKMPTSYGL